MSIKKTVIAAIMAMTTMALLTGCFYENVNIDLNRNEPGKVTIISAVSEDFLNELGETENTLDSDEIPKGYDSIKKAPIKVTNNGVNFIGEKVILEYKSHDELLKQYSKTVNLSESGHFSVVQLPNGNRRIESKRLTSQNEDTNADDTYDEEELLKALKAEGASAIFSITTDYRVVRHNATKVEGNKYIWDMIKLSASKEESLYFEYSVIDNLQIGTFADIANHWGKENIESLVKLGVINGYTDGTFRPNNHVSFAEFLKLAVSTIKKDIKPATSGEHWAGEIYRTAIANKIIKENEFKNTIVAFNSVISREDMALILVRTLESKTGKTVDRINGMDKLISDYGLISADRIYFVEQAFGIGLLKGKGDRFDPKGKLTRAEAATAIVNLLEQIK